MFWNIIDIPLSLFRYTFDNLVEDSFVTFESAYRIVKLNSKIYTYAYMYIYLFTESFYSIQWSVAASFKL